MLTFTRLMPRGLRGDVSKGDLIAGPVRLAHKYEMEKLLRELSSFLQQDYPSSFSDWLNVHQIIKLSIRDYSVHDGDGLVVTVRDYKNYYGADPSKRASTLPPRV